MILVRDKTSYYLISAFRSKSRRQGFLLHYEYNKDKEAGVGTAL